METLLITTISLFTAFAVVYTGKESVRNTTLVAPWIWLLFALGTLLTTEVAVKVYVDAASPLISHLRYLAAATTFCPQMALLGAKRPQDRAWFFVVVGLYLILALPSGEAFLFFSHRPLLIEGARSWFLLLLILMGLFNHLFTNHWLSALMFSFAQSLLLWHQLPFPDAWKSYEMDHSMLQYLTVPIASLLIVFSVLWIKFRSLDYSKVSTTSTKGHRYDPLWLEFRDLFGTLWALRVSERVNAAATMYYWKYWLGWSGFVDYSPEDDTVIATSSNNSTTSSQEEQLDQVFENLLLRFVSADWIAKRSKAS